MDFFIEGIDTCNPENSLERTWEEYQLLEAIRGTVRDAYLIDRDQAIHDREMEAIRTQNMAELTNNMRYLTQGYLETASALNALVNYNVNKDNEHISTII